MLEELRMGHGGKKWFKNLAEVVRGSEMEEKERLDVREHVESLISMATDPNILGRTWIGWSPWC